jgi:hypothetical protein
MANLIIPNELNGTVTSLDQTVVAADQTVVELPSHYSIQNSQRISETKDEENYSSYALRLQIMRVNQNEPNNSITSDVLCRGIIYFIIMSMAPAGLLFLLIFQYDFMNENSSDYKFRNDKLFTIKYIGAIVINVLAIVINLSLNLYIATRQYKYQYTTIMFCIALLPFIVIGFAPCIYCTSPYWVNLAYVIDFAYAILISALLVIAVCYVCTTRCFMRHSYA